MKGCCQPCTDEGYLINTGRPSTAARGGSVTITWCSPLRRGKPTAPGWSRVSPQHRAEDRFEGQGQQFSAWPGQRSLLSGSQPDALSEASQNGFLSVPVVLWEMDPAWCTKNCPGFSYLSLRTHHCKWPTKRKTRAGGTAWAGW